MHNRYQKGSLYSFSASDSWVLLRNMGPTPMNSHKKLEKYKGELHVLFLTTMTGVQVSQNSYES